MKNSFRWWWSFPGWSFRLGLRGRFFNNFGIFCKRVSIWLLFDLGLNR
jgi:hypothetical protein